MPLAFSRKAVTAAVVDAPGEAEHPRKQTWARWDRLAAVNKEVVAPLTGGHRNAAGGEDLRRSGRHEHREHGREGDREREEDQGVRRGTRNLEEGSGWPEEVHGGRNRRRSSQTPRRNRRK
jgi:hypothetical protein